MTADLHIVFEDENLLVIDKPTGLVVNRSDTTKSTATLADWVEEKYSLHNKDYLGEQTNIEEFKSRSGIVHRLDKDTSGLLVIAKDPQTFENLKNQFKSRETVKNYIALVHGKVEPEFGKIDAPIERNPFNRMHFGVFPGGREAQTEYKTLENLAAKIKNAGQETETLSLLLIIPHTGRTHQIRVHMKYINHPIVCDPLYCGRKTYNQDKNFFPRLFLHATSLQFVHPVTLKDVKFESPIPEDLQSSLNALNG